MANNPVTDPGTGVATRALDDALADTFPASDPPSMTSPVVATPSETYIAQGGSGGDVRVYRVIDAAKASQPFAANEDGGRWTPPGTACVYASLTPATALLEYLAHLEGKTPEKLLLAVGAIPAASVLGEVNAPSSWCERPYRDEVQRVGADWIDSNRSLALCVPSALCKDENNVLLNPQHPGFAALQLLALRPLEVDERLRI